MILAAQAQGKNHFPSSDNLAGYGPLHGGKERKIFPPDNSAPSPTKRMGCNLQSQRAYLMALRMHYGLEATHDPQFRTVA